MLERGYDQKVLSGLIGNKSPWGMWQTHNPSYWDARTHLKPDRMLDTVYYRLNIPYFRGTTTRSCEIMALHVRVVRALERPLDVSLPVLRHALRNQILNACAEFLETSDTHRFVILTTVTSQGEERARVRIRTLLMNLYGPHDKGWILLKTVFYVRL